MVKRIMVAAFIGWAGIVALAWWLAHWRIEMCRFESNCIIRATAARDHILTSGLTVALIGAVVVAVVWSVIRARNDDGPAGSLTRSTPPGGGFLMARVASVRRSFNWRPRLPHGRLVLATAFGMGLTAGLLWWGGMIRPAPPSGWQSSPLANASNPYADLIPNGPTADAEKWPGKPVKPDVRLVPVDGDPYANIPITRAPAERPAERPNAFAEFIPEPPGPKPAGKDAQTVEAETLEPK